MIFEVLDNNHIFCIEIFKIIDQFSFQMIN